MLAAQQQRLSPRSSAGISPRSSVPGLSPRNSPRDSLTKWGPKGEEGYDERKKWWNDYRTFVNVRDVRRLNGQVVMRSPRRLSPIRDRRETSPEKEMELWTRIYSRREKKELAQKAETLRLMQQTQQRVQQDVTRSGGSWLPPGVTEAEVENAAYHIKHKWEDKFKTLQRGFLFLDTDRSGKIGREEFKQCVLSFNLDMQIKDGIFDALFNMIDSDNDGEFSYPEMQRMFVFS